MTTSTLTTEIPRNKLRSMKTIVDELHHTSQSGLTTALSLSKKSHRLFLGSRTVHFHDLVDKIAKDRHPSLDKSSCSRNGLTNLPFLLMGWLYGPLDGASDTGSHASPTTSPKMWHFLLLP